MPSLSEAYPMILSEAKIFGIPSIICGIDYLSLAKGGTIIIYDDNPDTIAKESIIILKDDNYRKKLGKEARKSMEKHKNEFIIKKWVKLFLTVYKGGVKSFRKLQQLDEINRVPKKQADNIINNQFILLKKRIPYFSNITLEQFQLYSFH